MLLLRCTMTLPNSISGAPKLHGMSFGAVHGPSEIMMQVPLSGQVASSSTSIDSAHHDGSRLFILANECWGLPLPTLQS